MRLTKRQKDIIRAIASGEVWDILSFERVFQQTKLERYDLQQVEESFSKDPEAVRCYCPKNLAPVPANLIREEDFLEKVRLGQAEKRDYVCLEPRLERTLAEEKVTVLGQDFFFDLYTGAETMGSFQHLVEFLAIWQLLREQALVLEVPQTLDHETVGLFFQRWPHKSVPTPEGDKQAEVLSFSDRRYLPQGEYRLSEERLAICQEFLGRKLYPAPGINFLIQNGFRTRDEVAHSQAMFVAWVGIIVAVLIALGPYIASFVTEKGSVDESLTTQQETNSFVEEEDVSSDAGA